MGAGHGVHGERLLTSSGNASTTVECTGADDKATPNYDTTMNFAQVQR